MAHRSTPTIGGPSFLTCAICTQWLPQRSRTVSRWKSNKMSQDATTHASVDLENHWTIGRKPFWVLGAAAATGSAAAIIHACFLGDGLRRFMMAYLVAFAFVLS